jgi:hypothetical protein
MKQYPSPCSLLALLAAALLGLPLAASAAPMPVPACVPYNGTLFFTGNITLTGLYTSNVNPSGFSVGPNQKTSDWALVVAPTGELDYFDNHGNALSVGGNYTLFEFHQNTNLDTSLYAGYFSAAHGQVDPLAANPAVGNLAANAYVSYLKSIDTSPDAAGLNLTSFLKQNQWIADANVGYRLHRIYTEAGFDYTQTNYEYSGAPLFFGFAAFPLVPNDTYSVPVHVFYILNKNLALGAAYTFTQVDNTQGGRLQLNNVGAAALQTSSLPLFGWGNLTGLAEVGAVNTDATVYPFGISTRYTTTYYKLKLNYEHRFSSASTLDFDLLGDRNIQTSVSSLGYVSSTVGFNVTYRPSSSWYVQANLGTFEHNQYFIINRTDNLIGFGVSVTKHLGFKWWILQGLDVSLAYNYTDNASNYVGKTYNQNVVSLSGSLPFDALLGHL